MAVYLALTVPSGAACCQQAGANRSASEVLLSTGGRFTATYSAGMIPRAALKGSRFPQGACTTSTRTHNPSSACLGQRSQRSPPLSCTSAWSLPALRGTTKSRCCPASHICTGALPSLGEHCWRQTSCSCWLSFAGARLSLLTEPHWHKAGWS